MMPRADTTSLFRYDAQTDDGHTLTGEVSAADRAAAMQSLENAGLRVLTLEAAPPTAKRALRGADFQAFNQQLAHLTRAGLPVDRGLKLIAQDLGGGRLAESVRAVADELERGAGLAQAFDRHRDQFPPRYARLVDAGVGSGRLPAVLLNLGKHLEMTGRLKRAVWQAAAYPLMVLLVTLMALAFIAAYVLPEFGELYRDFDIRLPRLTELLMRAAPRAWWVVVGLGVVAAAGVLMGLLPSVSNRAAWLREGLLLPLPVIGPAWKRSLLARWCDLLAVGIDAGLDLPAALRLAGDGAGSPALGRDSALMVAVLEAGGSLSELKRLAVVPPSVPASIQLASEHPDLGAVMADLATLYEHQAETRIIGIQVTLAPILLVLLASGIGLVMLALFLPLIRLMQAFL